MRLTPLFAGTTFTSIFGLLFLGEELQYHRASNVHDLHTVAMNKPGTGTVGHVKREISVPCDVFILGGGVITCVITGNRQYSLDHPRGGLDVPCQLIFNGTEMMLTKIKPLLLDAPNFNVPTIASNNSDTPSSSQNTNSKLNESVVSVNSKFVSAASIIIPDSVDHSSNLEEDMVWVEVGRSKLLLSDKDVLLTPGLPLTDKHINFAQMLFKKQYPGTAGFVSTLLQYKPLPTKLTEGIQIIYCRACHWVVACKENSSSDVTVFDSSFDSADDVMTSVITNLFEAPTVKMISIQKQSAGSNNCGLFAISFPSTLQ